MTTPTVSILGAGLWGSTLALLLGNVGVAVRQWERDAAVVAAMRTTRENPRWLPGFRFPDTHRATQDMAAAVAGAEMVISTTPTQHLRAVIRHLATLDVALPPLVSVSKGIEIATGKRPSEIIREELPAVRGLAVLSGPNIALEIAHGKPAATVIASDDAALAARAQRLFHTPTFRPYTSGDVVGVETCGAVKNVISLAAGMCEGLGLGDNAKAALLTRAQAEIARLVCVLGGQPETVSGLAGIGDLMTTAFSPLSRNHRVGLAVGRGEDYRTVLDGSGQVAEGVPTTEAVVRLTRRIGVEMPICEQVYAILFDGRPAADAVTTLMLREPRGERG